LKGAAVPPSVRKGFAFRLASFISEAAGFGRRSLQISKEKVSERLSLSARRAAKPQADENHEKLFNY
jgi:hypothetical protein